MRTLYTSMIILLLGSAFVGCGTGSSTANNDANEIFKKDVIEQPVGSFSHIELGNKVGNIELKPATNDVLKVNYTKTVNNGTKELAAELFDKIAVTVRTASDTIYIETPGIENKDKIIAKYKDVIDIKKVNFSISFILEAPAKITTVKLGTDVGSITANNFAGAFTLKSEVGNIITNNVSITGKSNLTTNVGKIVAQLRNIEANAATDIKTNTGDIYLSLYNTIKCTLKIQQSMQNEQTKDINGGGVIVKAISNVGKVNVSSF